MAGLPGIITAKIKDELSAVKARVEGYGSRRVATPNLLLGDTFENTTLDTGRWTDASAAGGTAAIASGMLTLSTGAGAGTGKIHTGDNWFAPLPGTELVLRTWCAFGTDSEAGNTRTVGFTDSGDNNQALLTLSGTTLYAKILSGGVTQESNEVDAPNPDDNTFFRLEVYASKESIRIEVNGVVCGNWYTEVPSTRDATDPLAQSTCWRGFLENVNVGISTNHKLYSTSFGVHLLGDVARGISGRTVIRNAASDAVLVRGPGILEAVSVAYDAAEDSAGSQVVDLYDNTAASGKQLARIGEATQYGGIPTPIYFAKGLYFDHQSGAANYWNFHVRGC